MSQTFVLASVGESWLRYEFEGAEALVMKGLTRLLPQRPDFILETFSAQACETINGLLSPYGYHAYLIDEPQRRLHRRERVIPCDPAGTDRNHFLTTHDVLPLPEIA